MEDEKTKGEKYTQGREITGEIKRRNLLGAAAAVAVAGVTKAEAKEDVKKGKLGTATTGAGYSYVYSDYSGNYAERWFKKEILFSAESIRRKFARDKLIWGRYQKEIPGTETYTGWGQDPAKAKFLFKNWESAVHDARKDLKRMPAPLPGPDPDNPGRQSKNMLEHFEDSIRYALYDKTMPGESKPGIKFNMEVGIQSRNNRRHSLMVYWTASGVASPYNVKELVIRITCPLGGWLGYATLEAAASVGRITKFVSKWKVPADPVDYGQVLFIFNGLESVPDQTYTPGILQPVLQWTKADGWTVRSWYVPVSYTPTPEQLPNIGCEKLPGQQPNGCTINFPADNPNDVSANPYITMAVSVAKDDSLESHIEWDSGSGAYKCWFMHTPAAGGQPVQRALLTVPGLPPMTYAAAVIEGYILNLTGAHADKNIPLDGLPSPVEMDDVSIEYQTPPNPLPDWDIGKDDPPGTPVIYGTNRLKSYRVKFPANKKFVFTHKKPNS